MSKTDYTCTYLQNLICRILNNDPDLQEIYFGNMNYDIVDGIYVLIDANHFVCLLLHAMRQNSVIDTVHILNDVMESMTFETKRNIFQSLGSLPNLKKIAIKTPDHEMPISLLTLALNSSLTNLDLYCMKLSGKESEFLDYHKTLLNTCTSLHSIFYGNTSLDLDNGNDDVHVEQQIRDSTKGSPHQMDAFMTTIFQLSSLKDFCLLQFPICSDVANKLPQVFKFLEGKNTLKKLYLPNCNLDDRCGIAIVNNVLASDNSALSELSLRDNLFGRGTGNAIAQALKTNSKISTIVLSNNPLGDSTCTAIAKSLVINSSLKGLFLPNCNLGDKTCEVFAKFTMKMNRGLTALDLAENKNVTSKGYQFLADAIVDNMTLTQLFDDEFEFEPQSLQKKINFYVDLNKCDRGNLLLDETSTSRQNWAETLISLVAKIAQGFDFDYCENMNESELFYWIQAKPSFLSYNSDHEENESYDLHKKKKLKRK